MPTFYLPRASYHDRSFERQKSDVTVRVLEESAINTATCVLDVGCGAGQTLRLVERLAGSAVLIGLDPDQSALSSGGSRSGRARFLKGEGERLPIADGAASHVLCRVALNYMHQADTLGEMVRVLEAQGKIILSFHAFGYNLKEALLPKGGGIRQRLGNVKDLVAGLVLHASGRQGRRGTFMGRSVPHTSPWRLRRQLRGLGCEIIGLWHEEEFMFMPTVQWAIVSRKSK